MDIASIIFWAVVAGLVLYIISTYNHLVRLKHNVSTAWSDIDVLLKQRPGSYLSVPLPSGGFVLSTQRQPQK